MKRILCSDWFPEQLSNACLACFVPSEKLSGRYTESFLEQACSIKMVRYQPRYLFTFLLTSTSSRSVKTQTDLVSDAYLICSTTDNSPTIYSYTITRSLRNEKMKNESKELVMKLLAGLRFFVPICHFSVPRARFLLPVPLFSI